MIAAIKTMFKAESGHQGDGGGAYLGSGKQSLPLKLPGGRDGHVACGRYAYAAMDLACLREYAEDALAYASLERRILYDKGLSHPGEMLHQRLRIKGLDATSFDLRMYDMNGRLVRSIDNMGIGVKVDVSDLPAGRYEVTATAENIGTASASLIVNK